MTNYIQISKLNDFIFCPYSLYLHSIYESFSTSTYHDKDQVRGTISHHNIDHAKYSTASKYIQGLAVCSEKYQLIGKIDIYDKSKKELIERKYHIKKIYDGQKYQLFAQYFSLLEMGYHVKKLFIHSLSDNKRYSIDLPKGQELINFEKTITKMRNFILNKKSLLNLNISPAKCEHCIYNNLCPEKNA